MFTKVLVAVDDTPSSPHIIPYVSYLAKALNLSVVLFSSVTPDAVEVSGEVTSTLIGDEEILSADTKATDQSRQFLRRFLEPLEQEGVQAECVVAVGDDPAEEILSQVDEKQCDLIAMAARDRNMLSQAVMGSVTNDVLRSAKVPVLAVTPENSDLPGKEQCNLSTVLVPLDGTPFAESVLPQVEYLAQELSLEILLVRVLQLSELYPSMMGAPAPGDTGSARIENVVDQAAEDMAAEYLGNIANDLSSRGFQVRCQIVRGDTVRGSISELAKEFPYNLIALASHGRSGLGRWIMGSVAEEVVRASGDPVLVVPSQLAEQEQG